MHILRFLIHNTKLLSWLLLFNQSCPTLCDLLDCNIPRFPCPSPSLEACSNSCSLSRWYHPTISSSVVPFYSCLQSFPASGSFPMSWLFASGGQHTGASVSATVLPMNIERWFPLGWTGLISLQSKGLSRVFSNTTVQKHQFFGAQPSLWSNSHTLYQFQLPQDNVSQKLFLLIFTKFIRDHWHPFFFFLLNCLNFTYYIKWSLAFLLWLSNVGKLTFMLQLSSSAKRRYSSMTSVLITRRLWRQRKNTMC